MAVSVLSIKDRHDGFCEVTAAQDGCRFTMVVPQATTELPEARELYQTMADRVCAEQRRLREITAPGRPL